MTERGVREDMPNGRENRTYKMRVGGHGIYVAMSVYQDGRVGEIFIDLSKEGSPLRTAFQTWAIALSKALQYGQPLRDAVVTFIGTKVEPSGHIVCEAVPALHGTHATSLYDAIARLCHNQTDERGIHVDFA